MRFLRIPDSNSHCASGWVLNSQLAISLWPVHARRKASNGLNTVVQREAQNCLHGTRSSPTRHYSPHVARRVQAEAADEKSCALIKPQGEKGARPTLIRQVALHGATMRSVPSRSERINSEEARAVSSNENCSLCVPTYP